MDISLHSAGDYDILQWDTVDKTYEGKYCTSKAVLTWGVVDSSSVDC